MASKKSTEDPGPGPWWVQDDAGNKFATYLLADGLKDTGEDPFARDGSTLRSPVPAGVDDPATAITEGESR